MRPAVSQKATEFRRAKSAIREIMDAADPTYFRKVGWEPNQVISFAGGWVGHEAPEAFRRAYLEVVEDSALFHQSGAYSATLGNLNCRQGVVEMEKHLHGVTGLEPNQIVIGANSTQLTQTLLRTLLDPGDQVLLMDPTYCNYPAQILSSVDAKILRFPLLDAESWTYVAAEKSKALHDFILENKPKLVVIVSPDNPSSQVAPQALVDAALSAVQEIGSFLLIDFAYKELVFDQTVPQYFSWAPSENFLSLHSNSKWCRGLGRRLGWIECPEFVADAIVAFQGVSILVPDTLHQMAFARFLEKSIHDGTLRNYIDETRKLYRSAAEHTLKMIERHLGLPCLSPAGGLFTCMKVGMPGSEFVQKVLKATGVLFVPGWGFGRTLESAVRVSYGPHIHQHSTIEAGMKKVGEFLHNMQVSHI